MTQPKRHNPEGRDGGRRPVGGDLVIPAAGLGFTLYYFSTILNSPWEAQVAAFFVGFILIALILLFLLRTGIALLRGRARIDFSPLLQPVRLNLRRLALLVLTLGYVLLMPRLGFTIASFLFLSAAILLLSGDRRPARAVGIAALSALGGYALFILAFNVRFPRGPFEDLLRSLF